MPRGGKRPGAGAPKGNLNALKHGRSSKNVRLLADALAQVPEVRKILLAYRRSEQRKERQARNTARRLFRLLILGAPPQPDPELDLLLKHLQLLFQRHAAKQQPVAAALEHQTTIPPPLHPNREGAGG